MALLSINIVDGLTEKTFLENPIYTGVASIGKSVASSKPLISIDRKLTNVLVMYNENGHYDDVRIGIFYCSVHTKSVLLYITESFVECCF